MKKIILIILLALSCSLITTAHVHSSKVTICVAKVFSQRTYTLFSDGHYERRTCYTDGTCDRLEQGFFKIPKKGDFKHIEEVWKNGNWEKTVVQYY